MKEESLREEWLNHGYWIGDSIDKDLIPEAVMNKMADWWLSKLSEYKKELAGEVEQLDYYWMEQKDAPTLVWLDSVFFLINQK